MLKSLELTAFKSFPDQKIPLKPLTLLTGLNNSGKSSIIQALRMYCNSVHEKNPFLPGLGPFEELHSELSPGNTPIKITCSFTDYSNGDLTISKDKSSFPAKAPICCYVGANRLGPQPTLPLFRSIIPFPHIGDQGEYVLDFIDRLKPQIVPENLHHDNSEGSTLEYEIRGWLSEISPGVKFWHQIDPKQDSSHAEINSFRPTNAGFGISYTLPIIAVLLGMAGSFRENESKEGWIAQWEETKKEQGVLVIIENPEAHLHPSGQTAIGHLITLAVAAGVQVIVETHSDHLLDGIRIAVKDMCLDSKKTIFHFLSKENDNESLIKTPKLYQDGKIEYWPTDFFDQTLKNRIRLARKS